MQFMEPHRFVPCAVATSLCLYAHLHAQKIEHCFECGEFPHSPIHRVDEKGEPIR